MKNFFEDGLLRLLLGLLVSIIFTGYLFYKGGRCAMGRDAIDAGVAHWEVEPKTGKTTFVWNAPK